MSDRHDQGARPARRSQSALLPSGPLPTKSLPTAPFASALLAVAVLAGGWNYVADRDAQAGAKRQRDVAVHGDRLVSAMKDLEIGERGYVLTGRAEYLEPYEAALPVVDRELDAIAKLFGRGGGAEPDVGDGVGAGAGLAPMGDLVGRERTFFARVVATRRDAGADAATALVATGEGRRLMGAIVEAARDAGARAEAATTAIEAAAGRRALALDIASLLATALAVGLLARQSLLRRRDGQRIRERLDDVLGNAPVGLGFLDPDLTLRHANRALAEMMGRGGVLGAPLWAAEPALEALLRLPLEGARDRGAPKADIDVGGAAGAPGGPQARHRGGASACGSAGCGARKRSRSGRGAPPAPPSAGLLPADAG